MRFYLIICVFLLQNVIYCQNDISINNFDKNFLKILVNEKVSFNYQNNKYDYVDENGDNIIQKSEAEKVTALHLTELEINTKSLEGIENFINLRYLSLEYLDVSSLDLTKLLKLQAISFSDTKIVKLNVEGLKELVKIEVGNGNHNLSKINLNNTKNITEISITRDNVKLEKLNLKGLKKIKKINFFKNLEIKNLESDSLISLGCNYSLLEKIDFKIKNKIKELSIYSGGNIVKIEDYANLEVFYAYNKTDGLKFINIGNLYFENLPKLTYINCSNISLNNICLKEVNNLSNLDCSRNQLTFLPSKILINLQGLNCSSNKIEHIDFNNFPNLKFLHCNENQLQTIDINQLKKIEGFYCNSNNLKSIYLENLEELKYFDCRFNNKLENITLKNIYLEEFYPSYSTKHICVDNFFLNNTKYLVSSTEGLVDSNCDENNISSINPDITTIEKALIEFNDAIKNRDTNKLRYICTRKGYEEITNIKKDTFGETLLENYRKGLYRINNQNMCGIETINDKYKFLYYFSKQLDEWKYYGMLIYK